MRIGMRSRVGIAVVAMIGAAGAVTLFPLPASTGVVRAADEKPAVKSFQADKVHSSTIFAIKHLGVGYVYGRFNTISGTFLINPENPTESSVDLTIIVDSIDTGDGARDTHLKGSDFFNTKVFPNATFKSTSVKGVGDQLEMTGDLTIHGVTKRITVPLEFVGQAKDPWGNMRAGFHSEFTIKRSDFGVSYMPEGLGDDVRMIVSVEGIQH